MSLLKRLLSADYRAARAAEAAGKVDVAAARYALAGDREAAVRMHLARAARAPDRAAAIAALHDAAHWAGDDPALGARAAAALGKALFERAIAEGIATARDRAQVREAAHMLGAGGDWATAGEAFERIGDLQAAAAAYSSAGLVEKVEAVLTADEAAHDRAHDRDEAFADYQAHLRLGRRDDACADLRRCVAAGGDVGEYQRLLDRLEASLVTGGRVTLRRRPDGPATVLCAAPVVALGRDALCDLVLRTGGVSRRHAEIEVVGTPEPGAPRFWLRDAGSRNGTRLGGLPIDGRVPLRGDGELGLGDDCRVEFAVAGEPATLRLAVTSGLDRGLVALAGADGDRLDLARAGLPADVVFAHGRPWLGRGAAAELTVGGERFAAGRAQLVRGDVVTVDGVELDVE